MSDDRVPAQAADKEWVTQEIKKAVQAERRRLYKAISEMPALVPAGFTG